MIDRELMDAISQLLDVKLTNELGPIKYEIKSIKDEVREIKDEVREIKAEVKTGREDIKSLSQTVEGVEKRLKKVELIQENDIQQEIRQLFEGQRNTWINSKAFMKSMTASRIFRAPLMYSKC